MKILSYSNRKTDPVLLLADTPEHKAWAFLRLFNILKDEWEVYTTEYWGESKAEQDAQRRLYKAACEGNGVAAGQLLMMRRDYEYEEWSWHEVEQPVRTIAPRNDLYLSVLDDIAHRWDEEDGREADGQKGGQKGGQ